jgi:hypothetical protein
LYGLGIYISGMESVRGSEKDESCVYASSGQ